MPTITIEHRTRLTAAEIKEKAEQLIDQTLANEEHKKYVSGVSKKWQGNTLVFSFTALERFGVSGTAEVKDLLITIKINLPFAAMLIRGKIESKIKEKARELFPE